MRFTIRSIMAVVVVVAVLLTPLGGKRPLVMAILNAIRDGGWPPLGVLALLVLDLVGAGWLVVRERRRLAAALFGILSGLTNTLYGVYCIAPAVDVLLKLYLVWLVVVMPAMTSMGWAWATLATREGVAPRRTRPLVWFVVLSLTLLPAITVASCWPLRVAFVAARPAMERLADRMAARNAIAFPQQVGMYRLFKSPVDPSTGYVWLMLDPNPGRRSGFVRTPSDAQRTTRGAPMIETDLRINLGEGWWYGAE